LKKQIKRLSVLFLAVLSLLAGLAAFLLPILPGWLFIAIGLLLLSLCFPSLREWMDSHTQRWPKLHELIHKVRVWADRNIGEL
jgi:uncharacterized membrane protein YbaN (DUF454 family)